MNPNQRVAGRLAALAESQTLAMARRSRELAANGVDVISLSIGEPDYDTPDFIKEAAYQAIRSNFTHYPPVPGIPELRKAICEKLKRDNGLSYDSAQIVVSTGAKQSLANAILSLIDTGDEVIIPVPFWVSYLELIKLAGGKAVFIPTSIEGDFKITPVQLRQALRSSTRMLILNSPGNPSGSVYSEAELAALATVLRDFPDVLVISDEIYELIVYGNKNTSMAAFPGMYERTIIVNGVSKGFAMTGWRIGYIAAPLWISKACEKMQGQFTSGASSISQYASVAALRADPSELKYMVDGFRKRRDLMVSRLREIEGITVNVPDGAFYCFPDVRRYLGTKANDRVIQSVHDLCMFLLDDQALALVSGDAFGDEHCIRLSYATSEDKINKAIDRLKMGLNKLVQ